MLHNFLCLFVLGDNWFLASIKAPYSFSERNGVSLILILHIPSINAVTALPVCSKAHRVFCLMPGNHLHNPSKLKLPWSFHFDCRERKRGWCDGRRRRCGRVAPLLRKPLLCALDKIWAFYYMPGECVHNLEKLEMSTTSHFSSRKERKGGPLLQYSKAKFPFPCSSFTSRDLGFEL